ncbi:MAG: UDP-N-acetylmuramoyl-L-alanine--D-glutamate ligase [Desulfobacter sp.]
MANQVQTYDLIVGLGRSGMSMARFLNAKGRRVAATDISPSRTAEAEALNALGITTQIGSHDQDLFNRAATIIPSPGVPLTLACIREAAAKGVPVRGELDIFSQYNTTPVIAITGTNGKTTTTTLAGQMAEASGLSCFVGGNIGTPLVDYLAGDNPVDLVVAEISSYQLDLARTFKPDVGVLLNISEDHLDRYPDFQAYTASKWHIFANQGPGDTAVINRGIKDADNRAAAMAAQVLEFSSTPGAKKGADIDGHTITIRTGQATETIRTEKIKGLPGPHNRENIAAAALAVLAAGGTIDGIRRALAAFAPLPHRMAFVREINGVRFFNDSKATNTDAVARALASFDAEIILILGGREKQTDFTRLIPEVKPRVKQIMAIGESRDNIIKTFEKTCRVIPCTSMAQAVKGAMDAGVSGDVVLLSPACASFDMYDNYEARGADFITRVTQLSQGKEAAHGNA